MVIGSLRARVEARARVPDPPSHTARHGPRGRCGGIGVEVIAGEEFTVTALDFAAA